MILRFLFLRQKAIWLGMLLVVGVLIFAGYIVQSQTVSAYSFAGSKIGVNGWAWSSNIGWISFNCTNTSSCTSDGGYDYSVNIKGQGGVLEGYAWSSNIGWIQFGNLGPAPGGGSSDAKLDTQAKGIIGWARAVSRGGGWDGWISFNCKNNTNCSGNGGYDYGLNISQSGPRKDVAGFAWGSDVVGWIDTQWAKLSRPVPPALPECSDGIDNTDPEDTLIDTNDPGCSSPTDNDETDSATPECSDGIDNADPEDALADEFDPGCHFDKNADHKWSYRPLDTNETDSVVTSTTGTLTVNYPVVRSGETVDITWNLTDTTNCSLQSSVGTWRRDLSETSGSVTSDALTTTTEFVLVCDFTVIDSFSVRIIPAVIEI